ncbi:2'-5' RNA ligase family protein [Gordonia sp. CPCC 206044]|uniref:2'-5' RNA ligase family protein n=1 Tax=Gordonia sp. CPCC 206044 TaxID=3140793 RepID=UPI003AF34DAC
MVHSLELLLDADTDALIRQEWERLAALGLANQGHIRAGTNRPHVTLLAAEQITTSADAALTPVSTRLPIPMTVGAPVLFGPATRLTLARLVVPSTELLSVHAQVTRLSADHLGDGPAMPHSATGRWTPHITLARRLDASQMSRVLEAIDPRSEITGAFVGLRHWDGDAKTEHVLAGRAC